MVSYVADMSDHRAEVNREDEGSATSRHSDWYQHPTYDMTEMDDTAQDNLRTDQSSQLSAARDEPRPHQHAPGRYTCPPATTPDSVPC